MGSVQNFATGRPANPFTTNVPCLPTHAEQVFSTVWDHRVGDVRSDSVTIQTNTHGGDAETRPSNVYLTYLIRVR